MLGWALSARDLGAWMFIQGIDVYLHTTKEVGVDDFDQPIYEEVIETVSNVLINQPTSEEAVDNLNLTGRRVSYVLCIPKGDVHDWEDKKVEFFGEVYRTIGHVTQFIENLVPGQWNKRIMVERYE